MAEDDNGILRDISSRVDGIATDLASLTGGVNRALADGARIMGELRDELHSLRKDRENDRERLTRAEDDIRDLQRYRKARQQGQTITWGRVIQVLIAVSGWVAAILHPWSRGGG